MLSLIMRRQVQCLATLKQSTVSLSTATPSIDSEIAAANSKGIGRWEIKKTENKGEFQTMLSM
jgi:hypothetical protein